MALRVPQTGFQSMMKNGSKSYSGLEEAVYRNITACKELTEVTRTSLGPFGMNKIIINHIGKLFVTNDATTIIKEMEIEHPAAKMIVMASQQQEAEVGDGTNLVVVLAGELLKQAEELLQLGLHPSEIIAGFEKACAQTLTILEDLVCYQLKDYTDVKEVAKCLRTALSSKQYGLEDFLSELIGEACVRVCRKTHGSFNVDNVRVTKILGGAVLDSTVINGMVFQQQVEGTITQVNDAKIAVFGCPIDISKTETKGTVLIESGKDLEEFSNKEEALLEQQIKEVSLAGINVIVSGSSIGDLALHFCEKYKMMVIRLNSKFDLRRLCKSIGATALARLGAPIAEEIGTCNRVHAEEFGETNVVVFGQNESSPVTSILVRGATINILDDVERAINDGVNTFKQMGRDGRFVAGAGASELEISIRLNKFGETCAGLDQYAIKQFAKAFEVVPKTLANNCGFDPSDFLSKILAAHNAGNPNIGLDVESESLTLNDASEANILDLYITKYWAIKLACQSASTVLSVDQIIMAKKAGGPKARPNPNWQEER